MAENNGVTIKRYEVELSNGARIACSVGRTVPPLMANGLSHHEAMAAARQLVEIGTNYAPSERSPESADARTPQLDVARDGLRQIAEAARERYTVRPHDPDLEALYAFVLKLCREMAGPCWCGVHISQFMDAHTPPTGFEHQNDRAQEPIDREEYEAWEREQADARTPQLTTCGADSLSPCWAANPSQCSTHASVYENAHRGELTTFFRSANTTVTIACGHCRPDRHARIADSNNREGCPCACHATDARTPQLTKSCPHCGCEPHMGPCQNDGCTSPQSRTPVPMQETNCGHEPPRPDCPYCTPVPANEPTMTEMCLNCGGPVSDRTEHMMTGQPNEVWYECPVPSVPAAKEETACWCGTPVHQDCGDPTCTHKHPPVPAADQPPQEKEK